MADYWIDVKKVPLAEMELVDAFPACGICGARISFAATVDIEEEETPINGLVLSLPDNRRPVINDIVLRQGDYFTPVRRNEVIVNDNFARKHKLYPGSRLHLLLNNRREELIVVGTAISCEYTYLIGPGTFVPDSRTFGVFYIKQTYAEDVFDLQGAANQILVQLIGTANKRAAKRPGRRLRGGSKRCSMNMAYCKRRGLKYSGVEPIHQRRNRSAGNVCHHLPRDTS